MWPNLSHFFLSLRESWQAGKIQYEYYWYLKYWKVALVTLIVLVVIPLAIKYWWKVRLHSRGASPRLFSHLSPWWADALWAGVFVATGMAAFFTLLGPVWQRVESVPDKAGIKVVVAMDGSASTLAPIRRGATLSRWELMRSAVHQVFRKLPYDRKGFTIFASRIIGRSSVLTTDYERILKPELDDISEWFIADVGQGTNFAYALKGCYEQLAVDAEEGVCIIISDGEQEGEQAKLDAELAQAIKDLRVGIYEKNLKIKFYVVPVGDPNEAMKIPKKDFDGNIVGFVCCQKDGRSFIETRPDPAFLARVAEVIGGKFVPLEKGDELVKAMGETIEKERKVISYQTRIFRDDLSWAGFLLTAAGAAVLLILWK